MAEATAAAIVENSDPGVVEEVKQELNALTVQDGEKTDGQSSSEPAAKSKKGAKKEAKAAEKAAKKAAAAQVLAQQQKAQQADDPLKHKYGDLPLIQSQKPASGRTWVNIADLDESFDGKQVLVQGHIYTTRTTGNGTFLVLREGQSTVQALAFKKEGQVSKQMIKFLGEIPKESWLEVLGAVKIPDQPITGASQKVEISIEEAGVISRSEPTPLDVVDAARRDVKGEESTSTEEERALGPIVKQDTRLDNRFLDLRTPANQAIFTLQAAVCQLFREYLMKNGFLEIHTPKLIAGSSEGGANVFKFTYFGSEACLAQSPQFYKQMAIMSGFKRVFEIGPVFRAENSNTHRHLCEFTGLDFEMAIHEHYNEVMDVIEGIFFYMFEKLQKDYGSQISTVDEQFGLEPLQWNANNPTRISFPEGIALLKKAGHEIGDYDDLNTEAEKKLGALIKKEYGTDFFIMYKFPLELRPFYTMPDHQDEKYSNSFDVFIRGEEIISGAQRVHEPNLLLRMAERCGVSMKQEGVKDYVDSFRYGARPHGGAGVGLERVVMLFLGLDNIRKTSMFPRDPKRLSP